MLAVSGAVEDAKSDIVMKIEPACCVVQAAVPQWSWASGGTGGGVWAISTSVQMLAVMAVVTDSMGRRGGSVGLCIQVIRRCHGWPLLLHTPPSAWVEDKSNVMPSRPREKRQVGHLADEHVHSDVRPRRRTSRRLRSTCRTAVVAGADRPWHSAPAAVMGSLKSALRQVNFEAGGLPQRDFYRYTYPQSKDLLVTIT